MIVVALITSCMTQVTGDLLGLRSQVPAVIFVVTRLCGAVSCLSDFRNGRRPALKVGAENRHAVALRIAAGTAPWLALGWLHFASPTSPIWIPLQVSAPLYGIGVLLAAATVASPFIIRWYRRNSTAKGTSAYRATDALIPIGAIFLLSGSLVIGLFSALWLAASFAPYRFSISPAASQRPFTITPERRSVLAS